MKLRNDSPVARVRWLLMPWWAYAWRYRGDIFDAPNPGRWWHRCLGSTAWWIDKLLERLPGGNLFPPMPDVTCTCPACRAGLEELALQSTEGTESC